MLLQEAMVTVRQLISELGTQVDSRMPQATCAEHTAFDNLTRNIQNYNPENVHIELERLRIYFHDNNYPKHLIDKHIKSFISNKFASTNTKDNNIIEIKYITYFF